MISIIVPIYNSQEYLRRCIESILNQIYIDIEVILIDDGSTDGSLSICYEYEKLDIRVKVFHKDNSGVSDTRNYGIDQAKGEFISFCDSDDVILPNLYQIAYETIKKYDVDRVVCGYSYLYDKERTVYCKPRVHDGKYETKDIICKMIDDGTLSGFLFSGVNNSLFKRDILNNNGIRFNSQIKYNEDSLFSFTYMLHSTSVYSLQSKSTYLYRQHKSSATKTRTIGDKYKPLRTVLANMDLNHLNINMDIQMKRRNVTEALWQILDISKEKNGFEAISMIKMILNDKILMDNIVFIDVKHLNKYKRVYFELIKHKKAVALYLLSKRIVPFLSKILSR